MNRVISDSGGICYRLAELDTVCGIDTTVLDDGAVAVTFTLGAAPESTIELEYGNVTDYKLYFGPYTPGTHAPRTVLWRRVHKTVERSDLFPNGQYEVETTHGEHIVRVEANLLSLGAGILVPSRPSSVTSRHCLVTVGQIGCSCGPVLLLYGATVEAMRVWDSRMMRNCGRWGRFITQSRTCQTGLVCLHLSTAWESRRRLACLGQQPPSGESVVAQGRKLSGG